jgi:glutamine synthetase
MLEVLERPANNVNVCVGGEQEYFLIDIKDSDKRSDIRLAGRTLFGAPAPKGQEKDDQYYASIRERVKLFMADVNEELWKLGITAKTQHNEVAPCQHELAPIFTTVNIATDQNQLIMETLKTMARKHNLTCLLHEKPFKGLNGSGKHDNWSLVTDDGRNLLKPGDNPLANWEFLVFFTAVISAVDEYSELVRYSASNVGNDSRLGGNEAPPTIISVNTGEAIENILKHLSDGMYDAKKQRFTTGIGVLANFSRDNTDRNRTSPFAFTGNKFEFRMVGSSATLANPNTVLNTIVSEMLDRMSFEIEERGKDEALETAVMRIVTKYYNEHKRIIFNGNNYSEEWYEEAKKRGLPLIKNCIDSYEVLKQEKTIELYEKHNVMNRRELLSRYEVSLDDYVKTILIEARTMISMARQDILPSVMRYEGQIAKDFNNIRLTAKGNVFKDKIISLDEKITNLNNAIIDLDKKVAERNESDKKAEAIYIRDVVVKSMENLRAVADDLEINCDRALWPFPTYGDILFYE